MEFLVGILYGAIKLLYRSRPAILAEMQDTRTQLWGYAALEILSPPA